MSARTPYRAEQVTIVEVKDTRVVVLEHRATPR
jgi:hypothetical protein